MGYLNNSTITVDAILTKKGRELLARGKDEFRITQFALADDEIDYDLWNPAHPLGSNYYGIIIENMPLIEATADESNIMRYKLVTLSKKTIKIPVVTTPNPTGTLSAPGQTFRITPSTVNYLQGNSTLGYTAILSNSDACSIVAAGNPISGGVSPTVPRFIGDSEAATSVSVVGMEFIVTAKQQQLSDVTATVTIIGNETGGRTTVTLTILKLTTSNAPGVPITNA
jgi:hypothetical protein